jgi:hypothetical protein
MEHSKPLFLDLKILNIYQINDYLCSLFMYRRNYCKTLPDFYNDYFKQNNDVHNYNTRNSTKLHVSYKRTNYRIYILYLTKEFLYGIFLMTKLKILKHIFLLREKQNPFIYYLINVNKL